MKCESCGSILTGDAKFCPSCGKPVPASEGRPVEKIDIGWVARVLKTMGYEIEPGVDSDNSQGVRARHKTRCNFYVMVNRELKSMAVRCGWTLNKVGWGQRAALATALNKANQLAEVGAYFTEEGEKVVVVWELFYLTTQVSEQDLVSFFERLDRDQRRVLEKSGLASFAL